MAERPEATARETVRPPALVLVGLAAGYGAMRVVEDISVALAPGAALAVMGRNGAGKSTLLGAIAGRVAQHAGSIVLEGVRVDALPPSERCRLGLGFVPQDRQVFRSLTVEEHLHVAALTTPSRADVVYELFPRLADRRRMHADKLSGGEQQMLAIGRALMGDPTCLLLDEPFEGLAPVLVDSLLAALVRLRRGGGPALVIVEQHARLAVEMADDGIVIEGGRVRLSGPRDALLGRWREVEALLAVS